MTDNALDAPQGWEQLFNAFFPFSGDVAQAINPWHFWAQLAGAQIGFVNIQGRTTKPEVERLILTEVGSYGRQLGVIGDALEVIVKRLDINDASFSDEDKLALLKLVEQVEQIRAVKENMRFRAERRPLTGDSARSEQPAKRMGSGRRPRTEATPRRRRAASPLPSPKATKGRRAAAKAARK